MPTLTDWTQYPEQRPWARDLDAGDLLTSDQARCIDGTRLADFGYTLAFSGRSDGTYSVERIADDKAMAAGWYRCAGGEFTKIIGQVQITCNSAEAALEYDRREVSP